MAYRKYNLLSVGDKAKITENVYSVDGTLYEGTIVKIDEIGPFPDKDMRIIDDVGKIWYLDFSSIESVKL